MDFAALIIDDEETFARSLRKLLVRRGVAAETASNGAHGLALLARGAFDVVLLDYLLPDTDGIALLPAIRAARPGALVIMMTAYGTIENAVRAMQRGAFDYTTKSPDLGELCGKVLKARDLRRAEQQLAVRMAPSDEGDGPASTIDGDSLAARTLAARVLQLGPADIPVAIEGEPGSGKERVARALHARSPRARGPFVVVDCPRETALGEFAERLAGPARGRGKTRSTGAAGAIEQAGLGTLVLDEVSALDAAAQGALVRLLEERCVERATQERSFTARRGELAARLVVTTSRPLDQCVAQGTMRSDLARRLGALTIEVPSLRARGPADIRLLAGQFAGESARRMGRPVPRLGPAFLEALSGYDFPGNIRELGQLIDEALLLSTGDELDAAALPPRVGSLRGTLASTPSLVALTAELQPGRDSLDDVERRLLAQALELAGGRKARAAELLGISRFSLNRRIEKFGLGNS